jgi:hypothetical protein
MLQRGSAAMNAKARFNRMLDAVVRGVNDLAAEADRPADDEFVASTFAMFALAVSKLPAAVREETLLAVEEGGALRKAVAMYPDRTSEAPNATRH